MWKENVIHFYQRYETRPCFKIQKSMAGKEDKAVYSYLEMDKGLGLQILNTDIDTLSAGSYKITLGTNPNGFSQCPEFEFVKPNTSLAVPQHTGTISEYERGRQAVFAELREQKLDKIFLIFQNMEKHPKCLELLQNPKTWDALEKLTNDSNEDDEEGLTSLKDAVDEAKGLLDTFDVFNK